MKVLIVDDNLSIVEILSLMLTNLGCEVSTSDSGEHAIELCYKEQFDVALIDYSMPGGLGGKDTLVAIKGLQPDIRAYICSGYGEYINDVPCDGILPKPFTIKDIRRILNA